MDFVIKQKKDRLRSGGAPRVLDLFSGCGGLSLGFQAAGSLISAAVESDPDAASSHGMNFHPGDSRHAVARDITTTSPQQLCADLNLGDAALAFDVLIGGPPCQAFARVGRSKLREVADHPEAFRHDPRSRLYTQYLAYVEECHPLAVLMENVPDMLNHGGTNLAEEICDVLSSRGYVCGYTLLNSAHYGVPQMRERMFLIGIHESLRQSIVFPNPTHAIELPVGYKGCRSVALKSLGGLQAVSGRTRFISPPQRKKRLPRAISARQAIADLPAIHSRRLLATGALTRGARRLDVPVPYKPPTSQNEFVRRMRNWPGLKAPSALLDHVIRYLPRDYDLFAQLRPGDQYPEAYQLAEKIFARKLDDLRQAGPAIKPRSAEWRLLRAQIVPPYDPGKFPNKWRKMEPDLPARTLMAHLGKDSYSHIHYDSTQARTISVREAARLQSFPDGFKFSGTMNPAFRQIGNAVPPLLAKAIAEEINRALKAGCAAQTKQLMLVGM